MNYLSKTTQLAVAVMLLWSTVQINNASGQGTPDKEWVHTQTYKLDATGQNIVPNSENISYSDNLGRPTQSQYLDPATGKIVGLQVFYDALGRPIGGTMPAEAKTSVPFHFDDNFLGTFNYMNFSGTKLNNPDPVPSNTSLGNHYSPNSSEERIAETAYPYATVEFYPDPKGEVRRASAPGEAYKMGSGHESRYYTLSSGGELNYVFGANRTNILRINEPNTFKTLLSDGYKTWKEVDVDAEGLETITYRGVGGKVLATAVSGLGGGCLDMKVNSEINTEYFSYVDIHLPEAKYDRLQLINPTVFPGSFTIIDLNTYQVVPGYTIDPVSGNVTFSGAPKSRFLRIKFAFEDASHFGKVSVNHVLDYSRWTLYYYDVFGRLAKVVPPKGLDCNAAYVPANSVEILYNEDDGITPQYLRQNVQLIPLVPPTVDHTRYTGFFDLQVDAMATNPGGGGSHALERRVDQQEFISDKLLNKSVFGPKELLDKYVLESNGVVSRNGVILDDVRRLEKDGVDITNGIYKETLPGGLVRFTNINGIEIPGATQVKGRVEVAAADIIDIPKPDGDKGPGKGVLVALPKMMNATVEAFVAEGNVRLTLSDAAGNSVTYDRLLQIQLNINYHLGQYKDYYWTRFAASTARVLVESEDLGFLPSQASVQVLGNGFEVPTSSNTAPALALIIDQAEADLVSYLEGDLLWQAGGSPQHRMETRYVYDNLNRLIETTSPDEGTTRMVYSREGLLRFVQDAQQKVDLQYAYVNYDELYRPVESGLYTQQNSGDNFSFDNLMHPDGLAPGIKPQVLDVINGVQNLPGSRISEQDFAYYDFLPTSEQVDANEYGAVFQQRFTNGEVVKTKNENSETWYSYNYDGTLDQMVRKVNDDDFARDPQTNLVVASRKYKTMAYRYDKNHRLTETMYEGNNAQEALTHAYTYDANHRIQTCATRTGILGQSTVRSGYQYNLDGSLKRHEYYADNGDGLQGVDYVYTLHGQLKSMNQPNSRPVDDPGQDGFFSTNFREDVFGFALDYYEGDYKNSHLSQIESMKNAEHADRFDGLIKAMRWKTHGTDFDFVNGTRVLTQNHQHFVNYYSYDRLGQLTETRFDGRDAGGGSLLQADLYKVHNLSYDEHGNILTLNRNGYLPTGTGFEMDQFVYTYGHTDNNGKLVNNQLTQMDDAVNSTVDALYNSDESNREDLDIDGSTNGDFTYDASGKLIAMGPRQVDAIEYNASGLVKRVLMDNSTREVRFGYDDMGQRLKKTYIDHTTGKNKQTWYVRGPGGNVQAIYERDGQQMPVKTELIEQPVYGPGTIGTYYPKTGTILYEMTDHQGNVRALFKEITTNQNPVPVPGIVPRVAQLTVTQTEEALPVNETGVGYKGGKKETKKEVFSTIMSTIGGGIALYETQKWMKDAPADGKSAIQTRVIPMVVGVTLASVAKLFSGPKKLRLDDLENVIADAQVQAIPFIGPPQPAQAGTLAPPGSTGVEVVQWTDYYPYGMEMPGRRKKDGSLVDYYRNGYQGSYSEKDEETGWNAFELRMYDPALARWISPDPYAQYHSSYAGMGNSPINGTDADGGWFGRGKRTKYRDNQGKVHRPYAAKKRSNPRTKGLGHIRNQQGSFGLNQITGQDVLDQMFSGVYAAEQALDDPVDAPMIRAEDQAEFINFLKWEQTVINLREVLHERSVLLTQQQARNESKLALASLGGKAFASSMIGGQAGSNGGGDDDRVKKTKHGGRSRKQAKMSKRGNGVVSRVLNLFRKNLRYSTATGLFATKIKEKLFEAEILIDYEEIRLSGDIFDSDNSLTDDAKEEINLRITVFMENFRSSLKWGYRISEVSYGVNVRLPSSTDDATSLGAKKENIKGFVRDGFSDDIEKDYSSFMEGTSVLASRAVVPVVYIRLSFDFKPKKFRSLVNNIRNKLKRKSDVSTKFSD